MNAFSLRAVTTGGLEKQVAVSGYEHMPIFANAPSASSSFNLLRVLPGAAGRRIEFEFFDAADTNPATTNGSVQVTMPSEATVTYTGPRFPNGCTSEGGAAGTAGVTTSNSNCTVTVTSAANNGKVQRIADPDPARLRTATPPRSATVGTGSPCRSPEQR